MRDTDVKTDDPLCDSDSDSLAIYGTIYTVSHKKRATLFWTTTSMFVDEFLLLVPMEAGMNTLQFTYLVVYNLYT